MRLTAARLHAATLSALLLAACRPRAVDRAKDAAAIDEVDSDASDEPGPSTLVAESDASLDEEGGQDDASIPVERNADAATSKRCPREMVNVAGRLCIDRYEASLVDDATGERLSPHYPPEPGVALRMWDRWQQERLTTGPDWAHDVSLPPLPDIERGEDFRPRAVSLKGVVPQGYISGRVAGDACARAKKRLCTHEEWSFACRGEGQTKYPYGSDYQAGTCNVFRMSHPAQLLHGNASAGHSDPRLGLVKAPDGPLLRLTGSTRTCLSRWGKDAIYDMVGNEDEWIDDPEGTFVGGFFSRSTKEGCDSIVSVHPLLHWDYSIGFRCCK